MPLAVLVLALAAVGAGSRRLRPRRSTRSPRAAWRAPRGCRAPTRRRRSLFEGVALVALFLLLEGRSGLWWLDGVARGLAAWLFRGPLLVLTVAALTRLPTEPFWQVARLALVAEPAAGLAIAALGARRHGRSRR